MFLSLAVYELSGHPPNALDQETSLANFGEYSFHALGCIRWVRSADTLRTSGKAYRIAYSIKRIRWLGNDGG